MAVPSTITGMSLFIKIGDGGSPEVFTHDCLINTDRGITFTSATSEVELNDCDNVDDPAIIEIIKTSRSASVTGAGKLHLTSVPAWDAWHADKDAKNVQVWLNTNGYWAIPFKLTEWEITGAKDGYAEVSVTLASHGAIPAYSVA